MGGCLVSPAGDLAGPPPQKTAAAPASAPLDVTPVAVVPECSPPAPVSKPDPTGSESAAASADPDLGLKCSQWAHGIFLLLGDGEHRLLKQTVDATWGAHAAGAFPTMDEAVGLEDWLAFLGGTGESGEPSNARRASHAFTQFI